ncbi:sortase [Clostridium sediminicola]|uniref:class D sortase n=1 Tax=Clostridium sediminicola TaxID=3114879 RepID=UPI0031F24619
MLKNFQKELNELKDSLENCDDENIYSTEDDLIKNVDNVTNNDSIIDPKTVNLPIDTIGIMSIPKIDLEVTIGEGIDMSTLKYALGYFPNTVTPGDSGNFAVAGHRNYTYNKYFNRLNEVKIGVPIIVTTLNGKFTYKIDNIRIVDPKEVSVLDSTEQATITLVTCTPIRVATHRLIVKGTLVQ